MARNRPNDRHHGRSTERNNKKKRNRNDTTERDRNRKKSKKRRSRERETREKTNGATRRVPNLSEVAILETPTSPMKFDCKDISVTLLFGSFRAFATSAAPAKLIWQASKLISVTRQLTSLSEVAILETPTSPIALPYFVVRILKCICHFGRPIARHSALLQTDISHSTADVSQRSGNSRDSDIANRARTQSNVLNFAVSVLQRSGDSSHSNR